MEIRRATVADAAPLTMLHIDCWDEAYTGLMHQRFLDERRSDIPAAIEERRTWLSRDPVIYVADDGSDLVGMAIPGPGRDDDIDLRLELKALYVRASHYGTGLGQALLEAAIGDQPAYLSVLDGKQRAIAFYEKHGFVADGTTSDSPEGLHRRYVRR